LNFYELISGGAAANTAHTLSALDATVNFLAKITNDREGLSFLQNTKDAGISSAMHVEKNTQLCSPQVLCFITPDGDRTFASYNGVATEFSHEHIPQDVIEKTDILYLDGYTLCSPAIPDAYLKATKLIHKNGGLTCMNVGDRSLIDMHETTIRTLLAASDGFICNLAEAQALYGDEKSAEEIAPILAKTFTFGAVTDGANGAYLYHKGNIHFQPAEDISHLGQIDSIGAGDHFSAAILYGIAYNWSLRNIGKLANLCALDCLSHPGGRPRGGKGSLKHLVEEAQT